MKNYIIVLLLVALVAVIAFADSMMQIDRLRSDIDNLAAQVEQLQAERVDVSSLRDEIEDVKAVQGYVAWEQHWENRKAVP